MFFITDKNINVISLELGYETMTKSHVELAVLNRYEHLYITTPTASSNGG